jgi:hypothetical protein
MIYSLTLTIVLTSDMTILVHSLCFVTSADFCGKQIDKLTKCLYVLYCYTMLELLLQLLDSILLFQRDHHP